ncbi:MAG TPA: hypothetical protein VIH58_05595 [Chthoniobacterales bacterium]|jgi:hypothetical protein
MFKSYRLHWTTPEKCTDVSMLPLVKSITLDYFRDLPAATR